MQLNYGIEVASRRFYPKIRTSDHTSCTNSHDKNARNARLMRELSPAYARNYPARMELIKLNDP